MTGKCRKIKQYNKGVTMVETLVAFTILIILSLSFLAVINFSTKMTFEADDRRKISQDLDEVLAHKDDAGFSKNAWNIKLVSEDGADTITLPQCGVYRLEYPDADPEVVVLRFRYEAGD